MLFAVIALPLFAGCSPATSIPSGDPDSQANKLPDARFIRRIPWIGSGQWLKVDTHVHTKFSDGSYPLLAVVEAGRRHGCDAIAITDHTDRNLGAATAEYFEEIRRARQEIPETLVIAGVEWNVPPYHGDEHVTLLMHPEDENQLAEFRERFDDYKRADGEVIDVQAAFDWLKENTSHSPLMFLNHPSRKRESTESVLSDLKSWRQHCEFVCGFSGAPGHQAADPIGAYSRSIKTTDRWDPAAHEIGGVWDQLTAQGLDLWAALAPSDFHSQELGDFWPGAFSETWAYAADRSIPAVLDALQTGCFFANHGGIARDVELLVHHEDLDRPARPGEWVEVRDGQINVTIRFTTPERDLLQYPNRIDQIELIAVTPSETRILATVQPTADGSEVNLLSAFTVPIEGIVFRARGKRINDSDLPLHFVTNPIRLSAVDPGGRPDLKNDP